MAITVILRTFQVEVLKHSLCCLCAVYVMTLRSAGLTTPSHATDLCMCGGNSQDFWMFGSKVWSDLLQSCSNLPDVQKS